MSRNWKPGDVALWGGYNGRPMVLFRYYDLFAKSDEWMSPDEGGAYPSDAVSLRPLVVIDPEARYQVERLRNATLQALSSQIGHGATGDQAFTEGDLANAIQAALRSLVAEPEPEEPTGLGAVVDTSIGRAVRNGLGPGVEWVDCNGVWRTWSDLPRPLTVLSPGWEPES